MTKTIDELAYELIEQYKKENNFQGEAMDGDQVDDFVEVVRTITNKNEGNI